MIKVLQVIMPDTTVWHIPLAVLHQSRCEYVASRDSITVDEALIQEHWALDDEYELRDWAANNMNWSDVVLQAIQVPQRQCNYQLAWTTADMEIVESE